MKRRAGFMMLLLGLMIVFSSGCQKGEKGLLADETVSSTVRAGVEAQTEATEAVPADEAVKAEIIRAAPVQFVEGYGIVRSEYPVYILDETAAAELTEGEAKAVLLSVVRQNRKLIACIEISDYSDMGEAEDTEKLSLLSERYRDDIWRTGDGLILTGTDIPEEGCRPQEAEYIADIRTYENEGYKRYLIEARFEIPAEVDFEKNSSGYGLQILDFERPMEFSMKRAPGYETLEALAKSEGAMDTHDGISVLAVTEPAEDGVLVSCYTFMEHDDRSVSLTYRPPLQDVEQPRLVFGKKHYQYKDNYHYWDRMGMYQLDGISPGSQAQRMLFDVPPNERQEQLTLVFPGVTFRSSEVLPEVTLAIPADSRELTEEVSCGAGTIRLVRIGKMQEPQKEQLGDKDGNAVKTLDRPAVYLEVRAGDAKKDMFLRGLICQRKLDKGGWENQRYDFAENGSLKGFRVFYDEGDTEITLKFSGASIYWEQPFIIPINCI